MKPIFSLLTILLSLTLVAPQADARGEARGGGGGGKAAASNRGASTAKRSPMTGSKIERPQAKPVSKPASKPAARPEAKPAERPAAQKPSVQKPSTLPGRTDTKPADRVPDKKPDLNRPGDDKPGLSKPDSRPSLDRPDKNKPTTLPGMVSYPDRPDKGKPDRPNLNDRDKINIDRDKVNVDRNKIDIDRNKVNVGNSRDRNNVYVEKVNVGRRNVGLNRPATLPSNKASWNRNQWGGNKSVWGNRVNIGNDVNINIDNNFRRNNNYAYRPNYWGARPWWGAGNCHGWHHGHWGYGWNSHYYRSCWYFHDDDNFAEGFMWGIAAWSFGKLIYDMGYKSYSNPYPAPAVPSQSGGSKSAISYTEPVAVTAAAMPPGDDQTAELAETKSDEALERSRAAFKQGDYLTASKSVDEALGYTPSDVTLHEYRALVFFALGKYADAAGVLNSVLASGPGWGWDTMIGFYNGSSAYNDQLRKLEGYVKGSPDKADARFLLGYHYMVCGHMDKANEQFAKAAELQPADSISRQLRDLTADSIGDGGESNAEAPARPAPVPSEKLVGTWISDNGTGGKVIFKLEESGSFVWRFTNGDQASELKGTYGLDDKGLLVLTTEDSQMVSAVSLPTEAQMKFILVGAPEDDPGLIFKKG